MRASRLSGNQICGQRAYRCSRALSRSSQCLSPSRNLAPSVAEPRWGASSKHSIATAALMYSFRTLCSLSRWVSMSALTQRACSEAALAARLACGSTRRCCGARARRIRETAARNGCACVRGHRRILVPPQITSSKMGKAAAAPKASSFPPGPALASPAHARPPLLGEEGEGPQRAQARAGGVHVLLQGAQRSRAQPRGLLGCPWGSCASRRCSGCRASPTPA